MQALLVIHNLLRWLIIMFGFWAVISAISGLGSKREFTKLDGKSNFFFMLSMDIQLLVGLGLYFAGVWFDQLKHLGEVMKDTRLRFFTMEHELMMIIAWILVHVGRTKVKKATLSSSKFKKGLLFFGIALLLILIATPWAFRKAGIGAPWFRWF